MGLKRLSTLLALCALPAWADFDADAYPPYEICALCHGLFGVSANAKFPNLGGQDATYLDIQVRAFLSGGRHNDGGQMAQIVTELKPEDIPVVVEWFSTQDPPTPTGDGDTAGSEFYAQRSCGACHDAEVGFMGVPHLTSQHAGYLSKQMKDFRDGRRDTHQGCVPHGSMMPTDDTEIEAIARYLAAQPRQ
ncbi:cytochrome c553 [Actibacterium atlanticum]|uniref:Cytochrome c553 n=1 Tax=Actibacterium atlanticum TaxID=1461693 RepID=A0A058ZM57_9RHOB|nr:c-type cytochrome [Actibacterium atlanticum]KCV82300.1 cytochrome c553 [Actibacterium atlanticum]